MKMSASNVSVVFLVAVLSLAECRVYTNCELKDALMYNGIPREQIATWVCIANHESGFDTQAVNPYSGDYGIFQISSLYWCNDSEIPGKGCGITCKSLLQDDITEDIACSKVVFEETERVLGRLGFTAWVTYNLYCSHGDNWAYIAGCY